MQLACMAASCLCLTNLHVAIESGSRKAELNLHECDQQSNKSQMTRPDANPGQYNVPHFEVCFVSHLAHIWKSIIVAHFDMLNLAETALLFYRMTDVPFLPKMDQI